MTAPHPVGSRVDETDHGLLPSSLPSAGFREHPMQRLLLSLRARRLRRAQVPSLTALLFAGVALMGCGNVLYAARANDVALRLEEARQAKAEERAPYEYTLAEEHLEKAMSEAAEADYGDAYHLAGLASEYVDRALARVRGEASSESTDQPIAEAGDSAPATPASSSELEPQPSSAESSE
jgi:hypothetical protein